MEKKALRNLYREKRAALSSMDVSKMEDLILIQFQKLDIYIPALIMSYSPILVLNEFNPQLIEDYCFFKNPDQVLFYPIIDEVEDQMYCAMADESSEFKTNKFGINEPVDSPAMPPEEIDMIFVPLLSFDVKGYRVGYGKGYYDRFLKECRDDVVKIGFSFFEPVDAIDINAHDVPLDFCITPDNIFQFNL